MRLTPSSVAGNRSRARGDRIAATARRLVVLLLATTGCSDPVDTAPVLLEGLRFVSGDGTGFSATGTPEFEGGELSAADFAVALEDSVGGLVVTSFRRTEGTRGDLFIVQLTSREPGDYDPCGTGGECHGRLFFGIDAENIYDVDAVRELTAGTVELVGVGEEVSGSFADFVYEGDGLDPVRVEAGTFRLPLLDEAEGRAIMECFLTRVTGGSCE